MSTRGHRPFSGFAWFGLGLGVLLALGATAGAAGGGLAPATAAGWQAYVASTDERRLAEQRAGTRFLAMDFQPQAAADRRAVLAGGLAIRPVEGSLAVPKALVHHWRGAVWIPGVTVPQLLQAIEAGDPPAVQEDVLRAVTLARSPGAQRVFLRLRRQKLVTVVYNTEHEVVFTRLGPSRAASASIAVKIAEVRSPGTPAERELAPGEDRGFLWRLNAYWRYEAAAGGVIAECESLSLSRDMPFGLGALVAPLIASTARESMTSALEALRTRFRR